MTEEPRILPELLTEDERARLLKKAEYLWEDLQKNNLGGYSGINRPFHILNQFKEVIEEFGNRDVGLHWSRDDLEAAKASTPAIADGVGVNARKATMTLNLSEKEMEVLNDMAKAKDMSKTAVVRQALRMYQLIDVKMCEGKRMIWLKPDGTEEETIPMMAPDCTPPQAATDEG